MEGYLSFEDDALPRELFVCQFGEEACAPGYGFGPTVRSYYLIHFVRSGRGKLHCGGRVCPVGPGQGFLILPGEETYYQASFEQPWHYAWVGYRGTQAEYLTRMAGLDDMHRVFTPDDPALVWQAMEQMRREGRTLSLTQISAVGNLLRMISMIAPAHNPVVAGGTARQYCEKAKWYLKGRFDRDVSVQETADFVGTQPLPALSCHDGAAGLFAQKAAGRDPHSPCTAASEDHIADHGGNCAAHWPVYGGAVRNAVSQHAGHKPRKIPTAGTRKGGGAATAGALSRRRLFPSRSSGTVQVAPPHRNPPGKATGLHKRARRRSLLQRALYPRGAGTQISSSNIQSMTPSMLWPPSIKMVCPTMKLLFFLSARNWIMGTISSTVPPRPAGILRSKPRISRSL